MKFSRAKLFQFRRLDGEIVEMAVPDSWNQGLVRRILRNDYTLHTVLASRVPAEATFGTVSLGAGHTAGYIIPGAAILSPENPHFGDAAYCAYNMLVADSICTSARSGIYGHASKACQSATTRDQVFRQTAFYLITWNKYFTSPGTFSKDFALSLCDNGLVISTADELPTQLYADYDGGGATIRLKSTSNLPSYVISILSDLVPYCANPFLRFFYLYQVVEYLMGIEFDSKVSDVRARFIEARNPSMVELREILEKFQDATREKKRINGALIPACPATSISVDALLSALNALDVDTTFAERVYRVRNILFHDYKQLHDKGEQIAALCRDFFAYLVSQKLLS